MTAVIVASATDRPSSPIHLDFHVQATLNLTADEARRLVNRKLIPDMGTGLVAQTPELLINNNEQVIWRVPVVLSLPRLGNLGQVGVIQIDAQTGEVLDGTTSQEEIIQHARRLYTGSTLPTK